MSGANLADEIDASDVDSELERRRRNERSKLARFQPLFGIEAMLFREAAMVTRHRIRRETLRELACHPFRGAPRVDEHERRPVLANELGKTIVHFIPHLAGHDGLER